MENVENSLWQKRKQFKYNWSISLDSGCERTPFTRLECLVASAQCLLGVFIYVGTSIHSRFFNFHPTESDSICFMSKICGFVALHHLVFPLSQIKYRLFTPFFYEPLPSFNSFAFFVWMVHYQLENADECITMWSKCRYLLIIVSHCNYIIKDIHCFTCLVCQWISEPTRFLHFFWLFVVMKCTTM